MSPIHPPRSKRAAVVQSVVSAAFLLVGATGLAVAQAPAELVVRNARIYTVDAARPWAAALAVRNGRLVFVGADRDAARWVGSRTRVVDAGGRLILPGFHDTHVHLALAAAGRHRCDLGYPSTRADTRDSMAACVARSAGRPWVLMRNGNAAVFPTGGPPLAFLDSLAPDRPLAVDLLHSWYANSAALRIAGITAATQDPPDGTIVRDGAGQPTGTLLGTAQALLVRHVPRATDADVETGFRALQDTLAAFGIVSVQELAATSRAALYDKARREGWLSARVRHGQMLLQGPDAPTLDSGIARFVAMARRHHERWLDAGTVKIYVDGDLGDRTAALLAPYADTGAPVTRGEPFWTQAELDGWTARLDVAGLQMHFHAMGDRAVRMALDAVAHARRVNGPRDARHQITHLHLVATEDLPRFRQLGVVANVQPYFAENIAYNTVRARELLGPERHAQMFRFRDLLAHGATLAVSTDGPVASPLDPFASIQAALTRREPGSAAPAFLPEQRLTLPEVLAAYTIGGAHANFLERESGSLEVGKWADFVMLDRNLFALAPDAIRGTRVLWTVVEGRDVFRDPKATGAPARPGARPRVRRGGGERPVDLRRP